MVRQRGRQVIGIWQQLTFTERIFIQKMLKFWKKIRKISKNSKIFKKIFQNFLNPGRRAGPGPENFFSARPGPPGPARAGPGGPGRRAEAGRAEISQVC